MTHSWLMEWLCEYEIAKAAYLWLIEHDESDPYWIACDRAWAL